MNLDLKHLRQIVAIADSGNFAKAAERLTISQPALSRSLQALEGRLGTRLFDRGRGGAVPTPTGRVLLDRARLLLRQASEAEREIGLLVGRASGHVRIGAGPFPAAISVGPAVARLVREYPGLSVDVQVGDWDVLTSQIHSTDLDIAVVELPPSEQDDRLNVERLPRHRGTYYCRSGHPLTRLDKPTRKNLEAYPLALTVLPRRLHYLARRKRVPAGPERATEQMLPWIHVNSFDLAKQIVLQSDAISLAVTDQIAGEIAAGLLVALDIDVHGLHTNYGIVTLAGRTQSPAAETFMQILREAEKKIASGAIPAPGRGRPRRRIGRST